MKEGSVISHSLTDAAARCFAASKYLPRYEKWVVTYDLRLDERGTRCNSDLVCSNNRSRTTRRIKTAMWPLSVRKLT